MKPLGEALLFVALPFLALLTKWMGLPVPGTLVVGMVGAILGATAITLTIKGTLQDEEKKRK